MRSNKGVTMVSILIYVIVLTVVIALIATFTSFFYANVINMGDESKLPNQYSKLNAYLVEETQVMGNKIVEYDYENKSVTFSTGNVYKIESTGVYRNALKIFDGNIEMHSSYFELKSENGKDVIVVSIEVQDKISFADTSEYVLPYSNQYATYQDEQTYTGKKEYIEENLLEKYVNDSLALHYDGIINTENGYNDATTVWKDISGNNRDGSMTGFTSGMWTGKGLLFTVDSQAVVLDPYFNLLYNNSATIEMIYKPRNDYARGILFGGFGSGNMQVNIERNSSGFSDNSSRFYFEAAPDIKLVDAKTFIDEVSSLVIVFDKENTKMTAYFNRSEHI